MKKAINAILGAIFGFAAGLLIYACIAGFLSGTIDEDLPSWLVVLIRLVPIVLGIVLGLFKPWWKTFLFMLAIVALSLVGFFVFFLVCAFIGLFISASASELMVFAVILGLLLPSGFVIYIIQV